MKLAFALVATMSWMGCGIDTAAPGPGGDTGTGSGTDPGSGSGANPVDPGPGTGVITEVSGIIAANTTWQDTIHITAATTINAGVIVTVMPGTTVELPSGIGISVKGTLDIQGTKANKVVFRAATAGGFWGTIGVPSGGVLKASYLVQIGGDIGVSNTGKATFVDSQLSHAGGDLLTMSGGTLDMSYSTIGLDTGRDTTHCNMHVSGGVTLKVTHSNLSAAAYGLMFYGGTNANFTYNNWFGNVHDVDTNAAYPVTGNFSYSYFANGAPTNSGVTATNLATARLADAGPR